MSKPAIIRVAINAPLSRLFDYFAPDTGKPGVGSRVRVPFGAREQVGVILEVATRSEVPKAKLRKAIAVLDPEPVLTADDLWLIQFTSRYYHHPIGEVVAAALPAPLRQGSPVQAAQWQMAITAAGANTDLEPLTKRAPRQAELLQEIQAATEIEFEKLDRILPNWRRVRKALQDKGLIEAVKVTDQEASPPRSPQREETEGPALNADQAAALASIRSKEGFHVHLLDGVTGSGKTEVYLRLIKEVIDAGRQALVLVPEIGLTPQLVQRFGDRLGVEPALLHSALTDTERMAAWRAARDGTAPLIVGTRSAVFAPLKDPALIVVDEEHDGSLKQQEGLRYSARDLAIARAKRRGLPVVLGSATPSLETLQQCAEETYQHLRLPTRAGLAVPPLLRLVNTSIENPQNGLSEAVVEAVASHLEKDGQVLIFLNRRGYAPTLICAGCGKIAECDRCDARMTVHAKRNCLMCHHCGATRPVDTQCQDCGAACRPLGQGTERLEDALRLRFPLQGVTRIDSDSTRLKGTMNKALAMATSGEARILVGTQMLSKGHHFPMLSLVVVINADQGLFSTDFRGSERLAQSLVQVSGRAGREQRQGEVIIQTAFPGHPFWSELINGGYERVAKSALAERQAAGWPPFARLAILRASSSKREHSQQVLRFAHDFAEQLGIPDVRILGPVSAPMERKAGRFRAQLLLQSWDRRKLHALLGQLRLALESDAGARRARWSIDVDPIELF